MASRPHNVTALFIFSFFGRLFCLSRSFFLFPRSACAWPVSLFCPASGRTARRVGLTAVSGATRDRWRRRRVASLGRPPEWRPGGRALGLHSRSAEHLLSHLDNADSGSSPSLPFGKNTRITLGSDERKRELYTSRKGGFREEGKGASRQLRVPAAPPFGAGPKFGALCIIERRTCQRGKWTRKKNKRGEQLRSKRREGRTKGKRRKGDDAD